MNTISISKVSGILNAIDNCRKMGNPNPIDAHEERLTELLKELPHGSGLDAGVEFDSDNSTSEKLVFLTAFHHMNENGYYDGWTEHKIIIKPSLQFGFTISITGRDRNQIKEYLHEVFQNTFTL